MFRAGEGARTGVTGSRQGFSLIELLTALTIVGLLAGIAVPGYRGSVAKADAGAVYADFNAVRQAAYVFLEENGRFPSTGTLGAAPAELQGDVPGFQYKGMDYYWLSVDLRDFVDLALDGNALGLFGVYFNGQTEIADQFRNRSPGWAAVGIPDYFWTPNYALFLMIE